MDFQELYEGLDASKIDEFIVSNQEENLQLDFKLVRDAKMEREDRQNLAVALSGFANSDGGIIVWGIDARHNSYNIDCACEKREISPLSLFLTKLNEFTGSSVNPIVDGILHRKIVVGNDSGFAVTFVPASDSGPHMAKCGEDRYYKRSGDSFRKMEHFDLEDMFGRRSRPKLSLRSRVVAGYARQGEKLDFKVILSIHNDGRGSAQAPYLSVDVGGPCRIHHSGIDGNGKEGLSRLVSATDTAERQKYGGAGDLFIHPGTTYDVLALYGRFDPDAPFGDLIIEHEITAHGMRIRSDKLVIPVNHLISEVKKAWR